MYSQKENASAEFAAYGGDGGSNEPEATPAYVSAIAASNPYRSLQWYLDGDADGSSNGTGANIDAISTEYSGSGVVVGIIDQGFDTTNPDLTGRFNLSLSYDPHDSGVANITPDLSADVHGTWVSGVLGASANNQFGIVGVAPGTTLAGFYARFDGGSSRAEMANLLARQVNVDVSNNSWGYTTEFADNFLDPSWYNIRDGLVNGADNGRDGLGTVYVFGAGNDRVYNPSTTHDGDNTNYHNLTNSRFEITVAASTPDGHVASYSTPGASILVTAPGDSILSTAVNDGSRDVSQDFDYVSGTSLAAPIVSGVVAMMLQANPDLGYRDVEEILALSAHKIDPTSSSWTTNGATNWNGGANLVSNDFGFGLIDAHAAVRLAETWTTQHTAANEASINITGNVGSNTTLVNFQPNYYTTVVPSSYQGFSVQWVEVDIALTDTHDGDLKIHLISPTGTDSILVDMPAAGTNNRSDLTFAFSTDHDWGESPVGTWTLMVEDAGSGGSGAMGSYSLHFYGDNQGDDTTYYYTDDFASLSGNRSTLSDPAGNDTINAAAVTGDLLLDLTPGATSTIDGRAVQIAADTIIENAIGGDGNDIIHGNLADNHLNGGHGNDILAGEGGHDVLTGGAGADTFLFDAATLTDAQSVTHVFDEITDYDQGGGIYNFTEGDAIDLSALLATLYGAGATIDTVVRAVEDAGGHFALLQIDPDGAADGAAWTTIAEIDGATTNAALDVILAGSQAQMISVQPAAVQPIDDNVSHAVQGSIGNTAWQIVDGNVGIWQIEGGGAASLSLEIDPSWHLAAEVDLLDTSNLIWRDDDGSVAIWTVGDGHLQAAGVLGVAGAEWQLTDASDLNDGSGSEILWSRTDGAVALWQIDGAQLQSTAVLGSINSSWHFAGRADLDGDGQNDVVWRNDDGSVAAWTLNGDHLRSTAVVGMAGQQWQISGFADFNGDGRSDILWQSNTGDVAIWQMNGTSLQSASVVANAGSNWHLLGAADVDGDGKADILWRSDSGQVAVWEMNGAQLKSTDIITTIGSDWHLASIHDFNGDGKNDILWQNDNGSFGLWQMDGSHIASAGFVPGINLAPDTLM